MRIKMGFLDIPENMLYSWNRNRALNSLNTCKKMRWRRVKLSVYLAVYKGIEYNCRVDIRTSSTLKANTLIAWWQSSYYIYAYSTC